MRARIRHQLLPLLKQDFDPSSVTRLARLANLAREEETFWGALEEDRVAALTTQEPSGAISVAIADLLSPLPPLAVFGRRGDRSPELPVASTLALTRRLVRRIYSELRGNRQQMTARHVQDVINLATKSRSGSRIELPGVLVQRNFDRLVFSSVPAASMAEEDCENEIKSHEFEYDIARPGLSEPAHIVVPEIGRAFSLKVIDWHSASRETSIARGALDFDRLRWPMILRNWRPGDSYRPCGRRRVRKLKRLFLEARVPRSTRASWPVLTSGGQLVWASGYPVADEFAPRTGTRTGLLIAEEELAAGGELPYLPSV